MLLPAQAGATCRAAEGRARDEARARAAGTRASGRAAEGRARAEARATARASRARAWMYVSHIFLHVSI